ncbi:MAG: TlpA family protein disulfide reductase [Clostridia bacterium]|nr:TlpA family protein disulfide reductase [Clostridia bacterium]
MKRAGIRPRTILILIGIFILIFAIYLVLSILLKEKAPAYDFTGTAADGSHITLSDNYTKCGTAVLFYDTATPRAVDTVKQLEKAAKKFKTVDFITVSVDEGTLEEQVAKSKEAGLTPFDHSLYDMDGKLAKLYNISATPCLYFIDKDGIVQDAYLGIISDDSLQSELENIA